MGGRDQSERLVAINRNRWSQSVGAPTLGVVMPSNHPLARRKELEDEYREDVDLYKLASNLIVDDVVEPEQLRDSLIARFKAYSTRVSVRPNRKHGVPPV